MTGMSNQPIHVEPRPKLPKPVRIPIFVQPETEEEREEIYRFFRDTGSGLAQGTRVFILAAIKRARDDGRFI